MTARKYSARKSPRAVPHTVSLGCSRTSVSTAWNQDSRFPRVGTALMEKADPRRTFLCALANALRRNLAYASSIYTAPSSSREAIISLKQRSLLCSTQDLLANHQSDYISPLTHWYSPALPVRQGDYKVAGGTPQPGELTLHGNVISLSQIESRIRLGMKKTWSSAIGMVFSDQA